VGRPVLDRLTHIIGDEPRQKELLALRMGLFRDIFKSQPSRQEKRCKQANIAAFERERDKILPRLQDPKTIWAVFNEVYTKRHKHWEQERMQMRHFGLIGPRSLKHD
jgi:hypothetical protein